MFGLITTAKTMRAPVYFGHPLPFWQERRRGNEQVLAAQVDEQLHLKAVVSHGATMQQRLIMHRVEAKVQEEMSFAERKIEEKRQKLRRLLDEDDKDYIQELTTRRSMLKCEVCLERSNKLKRYEDELEMEKIAECQRALEREKIARGMQPSKIDEVELRKMQQEQIMEKRTIESAARDRDNMWHQVLVEDWRRKELHERRAKERRAREMDETRRVYDEQIASANRRRAAAIKEERERENVRIEAMKRQMEKQWEEDIKRKKEQKNTIEQYYEEDKRAKREQEIQDKASEREMDIAHIRRCQEELQKEEQKQRQIMRKLQTEKSVFLKNYQSERRIAKALEEEAADLNETLKIEAQQKADAERRRQDNMKKKSKEEAARLYRRHQQASATTLQEAREERAMMAVRVRDTAMQQVQNNLRETEREIQRQAQYRQSLSAQILNDQDALRKEKSLMERQLKPFVSKPTSFRDVMLSKVDRSRGLPSMLPEHPFTRVIAKKSLLGMDTN